MSYPTYLPTPSTKAYEFMTLILCDCYQERRYAHIDSSQVSGISAGEPVDGNAPPLFMKKQGVDGLSSISDEAFSRFAQATLLSIDQEAIESRSAFVSACASKEGWVADAFDHFPAEDSHSPEQLQAWLLASERSRLRVHWGDLADLYNDASESDKKAISDIFEGCFDRRLDKLYEIPAPDLALPGQLMPVLTTKHENGRTYCFNAEQNQWQRDDVRQNQYWIEGLSSLRTDRVLIATASTEEEALALATSYVIGLRQQPAFRRIAVSAKRFRGTSIDQVLMAAGLILHSKTGQPYKARLAWNIEEHLGATAIQESKFKQIVCIEKVFGVQWARIHQLESALGM